MPNDRAGRRRSLADRFLGVAAETAPKASKPARGAASDGAASDGAASGEAAEAAPRSVRGAAGVVALEALALLVLAGWLLVLTVGGSYTSLRTAVGEILFAFLGAVVFAVLARGLWRVASWARGPVVALQILFGLIGLTAAFSYEAPLVGIPLLVPVAAVLYLLATPEARLAYFRRVDPD